MSQDLLTRYAVHRLTLRMPLPVITMNSYFVEGPVPTLVDVPPHSASFLNALQAKLLGLGHSLRDVKRIIITHPHIDHFGSAAAIAGRSGAEVWVCKGGAVRLEQYADDLMEEERFSRELFANAGVPAERVENVIPDCFQPPIEFAQSVKPSRYLVDGDEVLLGTNPFRFMAVPGHTPWCMLIYDKREGIGFTGDFLAKGIFSDALCQSPRTAPSGYKSLKAYTASLRKVKDLNLGLALPGHGEAIENPSEKIEARKQVHQL